MNNIIQAFDQGQLKLPHTTINFFALNWTDHPIFTGVQLKHLVTAKETCGQFSFHLVQIAPNQKIGLHIHEQQLETHEVIGGKGVCINDGVNISYETGTICIFPAGIKHEVVAAKEGLFLLAKFFPALC